MTEQEFQRVIVYMKGKTGIELAEKKVLIRGRLENYITRNGYKSLGEFMDMVEKFPEGPQARDLLNALTTNHTYFWRESEQLEYFKNVVLPELKETESKKKDLHIWCAASSSGEEPYTLAMICVEFFGLEHSIWDTKVLATDIDTQVLDKAVKGVYAKDSVEQLPKQYVRRFFKSINETQYQVKQELKDEVIYRQFNLMSPLPFKKPLHVVFIRNVMIYFDEHTKEVVLNRIYDKMVPGGYLFIGSTESIAQCNTKFRYIQPSVYRK